MSATDTPTHFSGPLHIGDVALPSSAAIVGSYAAGDPNTADVFTKGADPTNGSVALVMHRMGPLVMLEFTLSSLRVATTDSGGSGAIGTHDLGEFLPQRLHFMAASHDLALAGDGTGVTDTAVIDFGVGSTAIDAAAETVTGTDANIVTKQDVTMSGGEGASSGVEDLGVALDGSSSEVSLHLNAAITGATSDDDGWIEFTGTIRVTAMLLGA